MNGSGGFRERSVNCPLLQTHTFFNIGSFTERSLKFPEDFGQFPKDPEKLLEDSEDPLEAGPDRLLADGNVGAEKAHERGGVCGALPHSGGEDGREEGGVGGREGGAWFGTG